MCTVFIYNVYTNTHTYSIYFENIYMYIDLIYIYIYIFKPLKLSKSSKIMYKNVYASFT